MSSRRCVSSKRANGSVPSSGVAVLTSRTKKEKDGPQYPYASDLEKPFQKPLPIGKP
jgi:hypothetical protein